MAGTDKITRVLILFHHLFRGDEINKRLFSIEHDINERSFDRDIEDIRLFLSEIYSNHELLFHKSKNVYYMSGHLKSELSSVEVMALLKILLSSRAFRSDEMKGLVSAIGGLVKHDSHKKLEELISTEMQNYISPIHNQAILKIQWDLNQCIQMKRKIELHYLKRTEKLVKRIVCPISVVFSELYFYLIAYIDGEDYDYPAFYRLDRITSFKMLDMRCPQSIYSRYNVGEMKKSIKFMNAGQMVTVSIKVKNKCLDAIIDQLPNANVVKTENNFTHIRTLVFEEGFIKWTLSQKDEIEVISPILTIEKIRNEAMKILDIYTKED